MASLADLTPAQLALLIAQVATLPPEQRAPAEAELQAFLRGQAWAKGELRYKLHGNQAELYDTLERKKPRAFFALWTRRGGKSFFGIIRAIEVAIRTPNARILYLAPSAKQAEEIVRDQLPRILEDCPVALRPEAHVQRKEVDFKNGSLIRFKGVNSERDEDLRGGEAQFIVMDELGTMSDPDSTFRNVVRPMISTTKGSVLFITTPPSTPNHSSEDIWRRLEAQGNTFRVTLDKTQNPRLEYEDKVAALSDAGERDEDIPRILAGEIPPRTVTARREYFCEFITDAGQLVIPEYAEYAPLIRAKPPEPPPYRDCYVGADWGMVDPSGAVFGYWDVRHQRLVIEGEWFEKGAGLPRIAAVIKQKQEDLWGDEDGDIPFDIYRVMDVDKRLQSDLASLYGLNFVAADKKDRAANIELTRSWVRRKQLLISPDCVNLDRQLRSAVHDRRGKDFERARHKNGDLVDPDKEVGHYDVLAALVYLVRYVNTRRKINPAPAFDEPDRYDRVATQRHPSNQSRISKLVDSTPLARRLFGRGSRGTRCK